MKVVYICGPYTAPTWWEVEQNIRRAESWALFVANSGAMPLCPHTNTRNFFGLLTPEFWYAGTLELMRRSDGILVLPNWNASKGCLDELTEANRLNKPTFFTELGEDMCRFRMWIAEGTV